MSFIRLQAFLRRRLSSQYHSEGRSLYEALSTFINRNASRSYYMRYLEQGQSVRSERDGHLSPGNRPFITSVVTADGQVTISWSAVKGADSYDLYYAPGYTIDKTTALEMVGMTSPATVVDLTDGMPYAFAVSAVDTTGVESRLSNGATAMPSALPVTSASPPSRNRRALWRVRA